MILNFNIETINGYYLLQRRIPKHEDKLLIYLTFKLNNMTTTDALLKLLIIWIVSTITLLLMFIPTLRKDMRDPSVEVYTRWSVVWNIFICLIPIIQWVGIIYIFCADERWGIPGKIRDWFNTPIKKKK